MSTYSTPYPPRATSVPFYDTPSSSLNFDDHQDQTERYYHDPSFRPGPVFSTSQLDTQSSSRLAHIIPSGTYYEGPMFYPSNVTPNLATSVPPGQFPEFYTNDIPLPMTIIQTELPLAVDFR